MKTIALLIMGLVVVSINTVAQNFNEVIAGNTISADKTGYETFHSNKPGTDLPKKIAGTEKICTPVFSQVNQLSKNTAPKFGELLVMSGAHLTVMPGYVYSQEISGSHGSLKNFLHKKKQYRTCSLLALNGVVMIALNIPYLIISMENKGFLKLCCQKTVLGSSGKACKKVPGLTFCVPLGK